MHSPQPSSTPRSSAQRQCRALVPLALVVSPERPCRTPLRVRLSACLRTPRHVAAPAPHRPARAHAPSLRAQPACRARPAPSLLLKWAVAHFRFCTPFFFPIYFQLLENTKKIIHLFFFHFPRYSNKFIKIYFLQFSSTYNV